MTEYNAVGVRFENINVLRDGRSILENITASAPCGGATAILGPNGAGKTTLLRCLLGNMRYNGKIQFFGTGGQTVRKPVIGYVPQQLQADSQLPLLVYEFLALSVSALPLWITCLHRYRKDAMRLLEKVEAEKLAHRRLGDLSGGELRRVLLAAALGRHPQLLVLDEAEAGVDYKGERLFWELLDKSRREFGFTLLMVTHNLPLAAHYATHVICIKKEILAEGLPQTTLTAKNLLALFGVPIHLYPTQCDDAGPVCPQCGALGNSPYGEFSSKNDRGMTA